MKNFRHKNEIHQTKEGKSDEIVIGESYSIEDNDQPINQTQIPTLNSDDKFTPSHFNSSDGFCTRDKLLSPSRSADIFFKFILSAVFFVIIVYLFTNVSSFGKDEVYSLQNSTLFFVVSYFVMFFSTVLFTLRRKKIHLNVKNGYLHIQSFPSLTHKIPVKHVLSCKVNTFNNSNDRYGGYQLALSRDKNRYSLDLRSGILISLVNGKKIVIGSENSALLNRLVGTN